MQIQQHQYVQNIVQINNNIRSSNRQNVQTLESAVANAKALNEVSISIIERHVARAQGIGTKLDIFAGLTLAYVVFQYINV